MKALIIDDEIDICYLLSGILKQKHVETRYVNTIADAKSLLRNFAPVVIFLDNHLPDGLGIDFVDHIKDEFPGMKIIMITAYDTSTDMKQAMSKGVDIFMGKPFTRDAVNKAVDTFYEDIHLSKL